MAKTSSPTHTSRSGFFGLSLNASQILDMPHLDYRIAVTEKLLRDFQNGLTATAIRNLQGIFLFYRKKLSQSLECFKQVLQEDPDNKNALCNALIVHQRLSRSILAQQCNNKISDLEQKVKKDKKYLIEVVCSAEKAIAYQFDCYVEEDELERAYKSVHLYRNSLSRLQDIDQDIFPLDKLKSIKMEINYWYSQCRLKIHSAGYRREESKYLNGEDPYVSAVCDLWEITQSQHVSAVLKSGAWTYLGVFSFKKPKEKGTGDTLPENLKEILNDKEQCFKNALEFAETTEAYIRYGTYLKNERRYDDALNKLSTAYQLDSSIGNWFALTLLAQTHFRKYASMRKADDKEEKRQHLNHAIDLWEKSVQINATAYDLCSLGEAYHMKAKDDATGNISPECEAVTKASEYFYQAVQSLGSEKKPEIHRRHGQFLKDIGEKRQAIESFKRAMEIDTANRPTASFERLFGTFLEMYEAEKVDGSDEDISGCSTSKTSSVKVDHSSVENQETQGLNNYRVSATVAQNEPAFDLTKHSTEKTKVADDSYRLTQKLELASGEETLSRLLIQREVVRDTGPQPLSESTAINLSLEQELPFRGAESSENPSEVLTKVDNGGKEKSEISQLSESSLSNTAVKTFAIKSKEKEDPLQEMDIELDGKPSVESERVQGNESVVEELKTDVLKQWKYNNNSLLYEMAYWFRFASKKYQKEFDRITKNFATKYPTEMAMIEAYFCSDEDDSSKNLVDFIHSLLKEGINDWELSVRHARTLLTSKVSPTEVSTSVCPKCSSVFLPQPLNRQDSTVPEGVDRARNMTYQFDFYVIFSEKEKDWVYYSLLQKLESNYGFKGAIPDRDFIVGREKISEMERCMKNSFKILMLIRSNMDEFDQNKCVFQISLAKEIEHSSKRKHFLIPVLLEDCCPPVQLSSLICVHAVEKYAWDKIVRSLEHR